MLIRGSGRTVLEYMLLCGMRQGDSVPRHAFISFATASGHREGFIASAIADAERSEWIFIIGDRLHLTYHNEMVLKPANDN